MSTISGLGGMNPSWQSPPSRKAEHEARMFAKVDSDGSGGVDATELAAMLEHTGQSGDSAELLMKMDGDGDGSLSSDELSQGMRELMPPPASTLEFAQQRGAANDDGAMAAPPGDMPPPAAASSSGTAATSTEYDPLDVNEDGTVSEIERLAGQLKELANAGSDEGAQGATTEIAALAQKLYDQIAKNWLQPSATTVQISMTA